VQQVWFFTSTSPTFSLLPASLPSPSPFSPAAPRGSAVSPPCRMFSGPRLYAEAGWQASLDLSPSDQEASASGQRRTTQQKKEQLSGILRGKPRFAVLQSVSARFNVKRQAKSSHCNLLLSSKHSPAPDYKHRTAPTDRNQEPPYLPISTFLLTSSEQTLQTPALKTEPFQGKLS